MNNLDITLAVLCLILIVNLLLPKREHMTYQNPEAIGDLASLFNQDIMEVTNLTVTGNVSFIPIGTIIAWNPPADFDKENPSGIPQGWALCDGKNGTPDLRGRFIRMYNTDTTISSDLGNYRKVAASVKNMKPMFGESSLGSSGTIYDWSPGDYSGSDTVKMSIDEMPSHSHKLNNPYGTTHFLDNKSNIGNGNNRYGDPVNITMNPTGGGKSHNNIPPFYTVVYLIRTV